MIRILLADDHKLFREGIKQLIEETDDMQVVSEANNGLEALHTFEIFKPDICLLDISMPQMDGLETAKRILYSHQDAKIILLTMYSEEQYAVRALKAGALGYITKGVTPDELYLAIRTVVQGRRYLSNESKDTIMMQLINPDHSINPIQQLSDRELQVFRLMAKGAKPREISDVLALSTKTIETYRNRMMLKLNIKNNAEIVLLAQKYDLAS
jgi:two-component system invasion response regulator UvrY